VNSTEGGRGGGVLGVEDGAELDEKKVFGHIW